MMKDILEHFVKRDTEFFDALIEKYGRVQVEACVPEKYVPGPRVEDPEEEGVCMTWSVEYPDKWSSGEYKEKLIIPRNYTIGDAIGVHFSDLRMDWEITDVFAVSEGIEFHIENPDIVRVGSFPDETLFLIRVA